MPSAYYIIQTLKCVIVDQDNQHIIVEYRELTYLV